MKNYIEIIYVDDNGLDHHVRTENVTPYKAACMAQAEMVYRLSGALSAKMRNFLKGKSDANKVD